MAVIVKEIVWPTFDEAEQPPAYTLSEFEGRLSSVQQTMRQHGYTHLLVYGDREHFANLAWLTNIDPRFEEALLIIAPEGTPLLLIGNECEGYLPHSPMYREGKLRSALYQPFSLLNQTRSNSKPLADHFASEGINSTSVVGCVGWKYFTAQEEPAGQNAIDIPSFIVDILRVLTSPQNVKNATDLFMHPAYGLRTTVSVHEIAHFEYTNMKASASIRSMIFGLQDGMSDHDLASLSNWDGEPLGSHPTLASGDLPGLCSPQGRTIKVGEPLSLNICYWGSNICRAGWVARDASDLPANAKDYIEVFAAPYFEAMASWFKHLSIGTKGDTLHNLIYDHLPFDTFGIFLNAGHLIHLDEWVSSPIYQGSVDTIRSGMVIQTDVIPISSVYGSTRMEDGVVIADKNLRATLAREYPHCLDRCEQRRRFMTETLGFELPEEVLPLSDIPAIVPPWLLEPNKVLALD